MFFNGRIGGELQTELDNVKRMVSMIVLVLRSLVFFNYRPLRSPFFPPTYTPSHSSSLPMKFKYYDTLYICLFTEAFFKSL